MTAKLHYVLSIAMLLVVFSVHSQDASFKKMQRVNNADIISNLNLDIDNIHVFAMDTDVFLKTLAVSSKNSQKTANITIPSAGGLLETFKIQETSVFAPDLAAQYPNIKSYIGFSTTNSGAQLHMSVSPQGVQTMISFSNNRMVFMQPTKKGSKEYVLYERHFKRSQKQGFDCKTVYALNKSINENSVFGKTTINEGGANNQTLQKFRIAISTTAEYTNYHNDGNNSNGDAVADALAAINASLTRVNAIFETDMAVTFQLINAPQLIYTNPSTDPYSPSNVGADGAWSDELQNNLTATIGENAYDIGHLFGASGGGGNAGCIGCVCVNGSKGSGYTSPSNGIPEGDTFDIDFVAHEIGHQMGANHTWAFDTEGTGVNAEPGSGTTIMAYAGLEGSNNVALNSDPYFHYHSINQILSNLNTKNCQTKEPITNTTPLANAGPNYSIPKGTAYVLKGIASDANTSDNLTYCWEQMDSGLVNFLNFGPALTAGSTNRSLPPSNLPDRHIPKFSSVLAGNTTQTNPNLTSDWETVSSVARDLNWALTVRDRNPLNPNGAQSSFDTMRITVEDVAPFTISNPVSWAQGSNVIITWNVGETTNARINCQSVNIKLSMDSGLTFPITIASNIANNGAFTYTVPLLSNTSNARLLIEAADNIFYDVSDFDFSISPNPDFFIVEDVLTPINCGETLATFTFNYVVANGFSESTVFSATNLPLGATAVFSPAQLISSGTVLVTIENLTAQGNYSPNLVGTSLSITKSKSINLPFFNGLCTSVANTEYETSTTLVLFNTINNASEKPSGYSNFTALSTNVIRGSTNALTVQVNTDGNFTTNTLVWVDWNQNCSFDDAGEQYDLGDARNVTNGLTGNSPLAITIPQNALLGTTTMRISTKFKDDGPLAACENGFDGEVEDYTLEITEPQVSISSVNFNTIDNPSTQFVAYTDFTNITTTLNRGRSYALSVGINKSGTYETSTKAWVDWNQNSNIEELEEVYDLGNNTTVTNGLTRNSPRSIRVPITALLGNTTLRISTIVGDTHTFLAGNNAGEVEDYTLNVIPTEAIEANGFENLKIFPNPNTGLFTMQLNGSINRSLNVMVFDMAGKLIFRTKFTNTGDFKQEMSLNTLAAGMYLLRVNDGIKSEAKKIIIY